MRCSQCGKDCVPEYGDLTDSFYFCSKECLFSYVLMSEKLKYELYPAKRNCKWCSKETLYAIKDRVNDFYCSEECLFMGWNIRRLTGGRHYDMKSKCSVCNKECLPQYTIGYGIHQQSFCSEECLKKKLGICNIISWTWYTCARCGNEFRASGVIDHNGHTYCSTECAYQHNNATQIIYENGRGVEEKMKTCEGSLKEKCAVCNTECNPKYTIGYGSLQKAFCSTQCMREWMKIDDIEDAGNKEFTCSKCGKTFWHEGVRDRSCHFFCSLDCACRYLGVAQYDVVTMEVIMDKEKEQQYEQRIKTLLENIDELQERVNSLTAAVESKEEVKRIRSNLDFSVLEPLLDKITAHTLDGDEIIDESEEHRAILSLLGLEEQVDEMKEALDAAREAESELFDKIMEWKKV